MKTNRHPGQGEPSEACCAFDWAEASPTMGPCMRPGGVRLTGRAVEVCSISPDSLVADVGCGAGGTLEYLEQRVACRAVGLDRSGTLLKEADRRTGGSRLVGGEAQFLPFRTGLFDALFCECVLSILEDRETSVQEFWRILKEGGFLVVSDVFLLSPAESGVTEAEAPVCLEGGLPRKEDLMLLLAAHGFSLVLWEEQVRLLKEFLARAILAGVRLPDLWGCGRGRGEGNAGRGKLSYFLLVARKVGNGC